MTEVRNAAMTVQCLPIILPYPLEILRQEDHKFETCLSNSVGINLKKNRGKSPNNADVQRKTRQGPTRWFCG